MFTFNTKLSHPILTHYKKHDFKNIIFEIRNLNISDLQSWYIQQKTEDIIGIASSISEKIYHNKVYFRGLIEFSNKCNCNCLYCGIRAENKNIFRYSLENQTIIEIIKSGINAGFKTFVLQSGEDQSKIPDKITELLKSIRKDIPKNIAITLSCGVYTYEVYEEWKKAGANRYLLRFETSDENLFKKLCPGKSLQKRIEALENLKKLNYEVGSGFMVGLPDETLETRLKNIILSKELNLDMVGIGPFIPHDQTPLKDYKPLNIEESIRLTALLRIFLPYSNIPATTAAGTIDPLGREKMLMAGANVLMPNLTPTIVKKHYLLYPNKICLDEDGFQCISCLSRRIESISKKVSWERGDSFSFQKIK